MIRIRLLSIALLAASCSVAVAADSAGDAKPGVVPPPLGDVPAKDRPVVAPDAFGSKDRKIVGQPPKESGKGAAATPTVLTDTRKPILAVPEAAGGSAPAAGAAPTAAAPAAAATR